MTNWLNQLIPYFKLMRLDRPVGTVLLACPMLWALWFAAAGRPRAAWVLIFLLGAWVMRSAGCVINDFADRQFDGHVERTRIRPLATGEISQFGALTCFALLIVIALVLLSFLPFEAVLPACFSFAMACFYPFTKRFFIVPQLVLGMAYASSVFMAFLTVKNEMPLAAWLLFIAVVIWTLLYDTFYAMVDREDDIHIGIHSSALWLGRHDLLGIALLMLVFLLLMLLVGYYYSCGIFYYLGLLAAMGCFLYQLWICKDKNRAACFIAFLNNQWVGVFVFLGILLDYLP